MGSDGCVKSRETAIRSINEGRSAISGQWLVAGGVERAVQLEEFLDDGALGDPVALRGGIRNVLNDIEFQKEIDVVADGLAGDARMVGELGFVELPTWREVEQCVDKDRDALVPGEIEEPARVFQADLFGVTLGRRMVRR